MSDRVITTEPLAFAVTESGDFLCAPVGTVCHIVETFDDGTVDLRTIEGDIVPSVAPEQYEVDR